MTQPPQISKTPFKFFFFFFYVQYSLTSSFFNSWFTEHLICEIWGKLISTTHEIQKHTTDKGELMLAWGLITAPTKKENTLWSDTAGRLLANTAVFFFFFTLTRPRAGWLSKKKKKKDSSCLERSPKVVGHHPVILNRCYKRCKRPDPSPAPGTKQRGRFRAKDKTIMTQLADKQKQLLQATKKNNPNKNLLSWLLFPRFF